MPEPQAANRNSTSITSMFKRLSREEWETKYGPIVYCEDDAAHLSTIEQMALMNYDPENYFNRMNPSDRELLERLFTLAKRLQLSTNLPSPFEHFLNQRLSL